MRSTARPGSPPQVRGKLLAVRLSPVLFRITPAGAGKTLKYILLCPKWWDHPRRCGENTAQWTQKRLIGGSPPQVRGKRISSTNFIFISGITPAGAGKTFRLSPAKIAAEDHPRRCGENIHISADFFAHIGSPPQVRGKLALIANLPQIIGITPAGAGKTLGSGRSAVGIRDHPRRCGENA